MTTDLLPDATELFQILQITAQSIIIDNPKILALQKWAKKRATYTSHYKENAKRAFYWYVFLSFGVELVRYCAHETQLQSCSEFISDFTNPFVATLDKLLDLSLELDSGINVIYKINYFETTLASKIAHDLSADVDTLGASYIPSLIFFLNSLIAFPITQADLANPTFIPVSKQPSYKNIIFDLLTSQLVLIVNSWDDFKYSKEFEKGLRIFYDLWKKTHPFPLDSKNIPDFHSEANIQKFKTSIYKFTEGFFNISLDEITNWESNNPWDTDDLNTVLSYLDVNLLIRDCLQAVDVKNYKVIEDMILNIPKTTSEIRSYLPHKKNPIVIPF